MKWIELAKHIRSWDSIYCKQPSCLDTLISVIDICQCRYERSAAESAADAAVAAAAARWAVGARLSKSDDDVGSQLSTRLELTGYKLKLEPAAVYCP